MLSLTSFLVIWVPPLPKVLVALTFIDNVELSAQITDVTPWPDRVIVMVHPVKEIFVHLGVFNEVIDNSTKFLEIEGLGIDISAWWHEPGTRNKEVMPIDSYNIEDNANMIYGRRSHIALISK